MVHDAALIMYQSLFCSHFDCRMLTTQPWVNQTILLEYLCKTVKVLIKILLQRVWNDISII